MEKLFSGLNINEFVGEYPDESSSSSSEEEVYTEVPQVRNNRATEVGETSRGRIMMDGVLTPVQPEPIQVIVPNAYAESSRRPRDFVPFGSYQNRGVPRIRRNGVPDKYQPHDNYLTQDDDYLDLDCVTNRAKEIDGFFKRINMIVAINPTHFQENDFDGVDRYIEHMLHGNVQRWWNSAQGTQARIAARTATPELPAPTSTNEYLQRLQRIIGIVFDGVNETNRQAVVEHERQKAKYMLANMQLCDICYWVEFTCEFERWFYVLPSEEWPTYMNMYIDKLPSYWSIEIRNKWNAREAHISSELGGIIRLLRECIEERCKQMAINKTIKYQTEACCNPDLIDIPGQYGCRPAPKKKKRFIKKKPPVRRRRVPQRRYRRYVPRYRRYPRRRTNTNPNQPRYRRRRRNFRRRTGKLAEGVEEDPDCPQGKPKGKCKCWLCKEEGHYANECPNKTKKQFKEQAKQLEIINYMGFQPIESDNESDYSDYDIDFDLEIREFGPKDELSSDWEPVTEDEQSESEGSESSLEDDWKNLQNKRNSRIYP